MSSVQTWNVALIITSLFALPCNAKEGWLELDLYECEDYPAALFCDKGCVREEPAVKLRVQVDSGKGKVLLQTVASKAMPSNRFLEGCEVFDVKNWDCSTKQPTDVVSLASMKIETIVMTSGVYTAVADASLREVIKPRCAK